MRACIVTRAGPPHGIGGMQDHTFDLARGLVAAGHDVEVITGRHPDGRVDDILQGVQWRFIDAPADDFTNQKWRTCSYETFEQLDREKPFDVVHGEGSSALELVRRGVQRRLPLVVEFHGNYVGLAKASLGRQLRARRPRELLREQHGLLALTRRHFALGNWRLFRTCEAIVPSEQQLADTCRSHRLDPRRVHVVPNGVDQALFRPRPKAELRTELGLEDGPLFVCAGRLSHEKGTHHALRALADVQASIPGARLLIIGDGPEREPLGRLASKLGLGDRVTFAGSQPPSMMPQYLAAADVFLFPTERDEAAPLVLPQAMACGLAVIASARGGIPEVLERSGENGILVPAGDVRALAEAARALGADPDLRARLGAAARRRVEAAYTLERMVEGTLAVYAVARQRLSEAQ